ncbi:MAG: cell wall-binding repeat-containing protein [Lachnospiraceae bacterium]|nr:cell wall-binding repeat-containing protein [Lachnospiraceae bacterium]
MAKRKSKFWGVCLAIALLLNSMGLPYLEAQAADENTALGKTVTVSSVEVAMPGNTGDQTVDGNTSTRWSSERMKDSGATDETEQTPQWLIIDLAAEQTNVTELKVSFFKKVWATKYQIQTADTNTNETTWETVKSIERASGSLSDNPIDTFTDVTSLKRYVRFYFEKINVNAGGTGVSVTEISILGTQDGAVTPEEPKLNVVGSELENVVSNDGVYSEWNIGERDVVLLVKNASGTKSNTTVTVPDHSANYPEEWFPAVSEPNEKPEVIPTIQEWYGYEGDFTLTEDSKIIINDAANAGLEKVAENMQADVAEISGITLTIAEGTEPESANDIYIESLTDAELYDLGEEGYLMITNEDGVQIYAPTYTGCLYGTITAEQILWMDDEHVAIPKGIMRDYPAYEVRGVKLDIARTPYRYEQLQDYAKIMLWYKMSEYDLHINDNDNANINGATTESHSGFHRLESEEFPSLTSETKHAGIPKELVNADYYNNNADYQGNPTYTKEQWRDLAALAEDYGMYLLTEIDLPGHSLLYNKYAEENPDNIDWLEGGIAYTKNELGTDGGIELMDLTGANADRALQFARTLWNEYTSGDEPTIYGDIVHIGADEYWVHNTATHNAFAAFADEMRQVIQNNLGEDTKIRMWGAGSSSFATATTVLGMTSAELAEQYQLDIWHTSYDNPAQRIAEGYQVVNCRDAFLYGNPGRTNRDLPNAEYLFNDWNPTIFGGNNPLLGEPNLIGAKAVLWGDQSQEGMTEKDIHQRVLQAIAIVSEKTWNGTDEDDTFAEWEIRKSRLAEGPGTQIAMKIESVSSLVLDYDFENISKDGKTVYDASGNGYDAAVTGGSVKDGWMSFDGDTLVETPLKTLSYPYTVSFDLKLSAAKGAENTEESSLFSGYDGRIQVAGHNGNMSADVNYFTRDFDYKVPADGTEAEVTLVGTFQGTKLYVDGELVTFLSQKADADGLLGAVTSLYSSVLLPLEKIGQDFHGQMANLKVYNKALSAEEVAAVYAGTADGKVNVAQNTHAGSDSYKSGDAQDNAEQRTRTAMKTIDGDAFELQENVTAQPDATTSDIYSYWKGDHADSSLTIDLGEERQISEIGIQWRYGGKGKDMNILTSLDGDNWTVTKNVTGNTAFFQTITFDEAVNTRYIKVQGISSHSVSGYMIQEFMAYEQVNKDALGAVLAQAEAIVEEENLGFENGSKAEKSLFEAVVLARAMEESPLATISEVNAAEEKLSAALKEFEENEELQGVYRISGTTRYETGYKVADALKEELGVEKFDAVVVATGKNFADALAGSYLAVQKNAPIILTNGKDDNVAQLHEYIAANVAAGGKVYILGGEAAVPASVEAIEGYDVVRLSGKSRYETNLAILAEAGIEGTELIVATGKTFADSLSASAAKLPILLVKPGTALSDEAKAIAEGMNKFYIIGGEGAVSADIAAELAAYGEVVRVSGKTRYETSVAVANTFFADVEKSVVASGKNFPDGLCGGPLAAAMNAPLILTADGKTDAAASYVADNEIESGYVLGGTGALADESVVDVFALESADEINK